MIRQLGIVCIVVTLSIPGSVSATVIDFNSLPPGPVSGDILNITADGVSVTFSATGLTVLHLVNTVFDEIVLRSGNNQDPITVTFGGGFTAFFVEVENHVNGELSNEVDIIMGTAFDSLDTLLDSATNSNEIHHLDGPGIAKVIYDDDGTGFLIDNFTFSAFPIPEPCTLVLATFGMLGIAFSGRRCKR